MATSLIHPNSDDKSMTNPDPWNGDLDWFVNDRVYTLACPPWTTLATRTPFMNNTEDWREASGAVFTMAMLPCNRFMGGAGDMVHHTAPFSQRLHSSCQLLLLFFITIIIIIKGAPFSQPMHSCWKWKQSIYGWAFYWKIILLKEIGLDGRILIFIYILKTLLI